MDADPPATLPPPVGGYGAAPPSARFGPTDEARAPRRDLTPFLTAAAILVSLSSVLVLVVLGCRRYVAVARTAEVRRELSQIASDAAAAHERDHRMCPSASAPVPPDDAWISGRKYQSRRSDWTVDAPSNAGFACLGYEMTSIQYFQYGYAATPSSFTARGRGDLNGDGVFSEFTWSGHVEGGHVVVARAITEKNIEE